MSAVAERLSTALADRYRIERELGAGGMATVYLAQDVRHDRKVAIKVLKPELAAVLGAERFVVEIKTTAALSHPHILPLFDSGTADRFLFYVMPYIQGDTIREKLNRETQFGVDEAVRIAREVADALDYAHRHGVIHRDIKPENILLHDGRAMVMDFGIALAVSAAAGGRMTETGLSLGTPHYMSPEQATAEKEITARSDQYSLASVLYEMLAGQPPHVGGAAQQVIMRIITEPARPVNEFRRNVPPNVVATLAKALEKLPADRFESAAKFAEALRNAAFTTATTGAALGVAGGPGQWIRHRFSRASLAMVLLLAALLGWLATRAERSAVDPPAMIAFTVMDTVTSFDVSKDGAIAFSRGGKLYVRRAGETIATEIQGVERPVGTPMFSPDGRDIAVATEVVGKPGITLIVRVPTMGGVATPLFTGAGGFPVVQGWSDDGWIYADEAPGTSRDSIRLVRFRETGGESQVVFRGFLFPVTALPGGRVIVGCMRNQRDDRLIALELASGDTSHIADDACASAWSPTGHLLATFGDGTLRAIPFDPESRRVTGVPVVLRDDVGREFRLTADGTLLYIRGGAQRATFEYVMIAPDGRRTPLPVGPGSLGLARFSPEGQSLAYSNDAGLWIYDLAIGTNRQVARYGFGPVWSPDGKRLASAGESNGLVVRGLDADSSVVRLDSAAVRYATQWLPDGTILTSRASPSGLGMDIAAYRADSVGVSRTILGADWNESDAQVSPSGRWVAYISREPDWNQLTVRTWPGLDRKVVIADSVGTWEVKWSPDGNTLYYRKGRRLMAATLARGESRYATSHRVVADSVDTFTDIHPDGNRFLVRRSLLPGGRSIRTLVGITGWLGELRRRVAAGERR